MNNFLSSKQVSEMLGVRVRTIQRLTNQGKIKAIKIGKLFKYNKNDIERYLLQGIDFSKEPTRKQTGFVEHRAYPRINCFLPCHINVIIPQKKEIFTQARIINISIGGVFLEDCASVNVTNDDPISLKFQLDEKCNLEVNGRILRTQHENIAVKFKKIHPQVREAIEEYVG